LQAAEGGLSIQSALDASRRQSLLTHPKPAIRELAGRLFAGDAPSERSEVLVAYRKAIGEVAGDRQAGKQTFQSKCANCHQLEGQGFALGPLLASSSLRDGEALLTHILDPNRYVAPNYVQYTAIDVRGRIYSGLLSSQTPASITLRREKGASDTILRDEIEEIAATGKSLMPEGFEKEIDPAAMADLVAYLTHVAAQAPQEGNPHRERDFGTLPGLIEK
jgi:putative heme-binding domain-containing protein